MSVHPLERRDSVCSPWITGDWFIKDGEWNVVIGFAQSGNKHYVVSCLGKDASFLSVSDMTPEDIEEVLVSEIRGSHEFFPMTPYDFPDCFLVSSSSDESKRWKRPCHRVVIAKNSGKLTEQVRVMQLGSDIVLPEEDFSEEIIDDLLNSMYEGKPCDTKLVPVALVLEWGFYKLLEYYKEIPITPEIMSSITQAVFEGKYGLMPNTRKFLIDQLGK